MEMTEQKQSEEKDTEILNTLVEIKSDPIVRDDSEVFPWTLYITTTNDNNVVYSVYIYDEIYEPQYYSKLFEIIRNIKETEFLNVHLNSPGGSLYTLVAFVNVIQECLGKVTMIVDGFAESAAAILAFTGDDLVIREHSSMMFHNIHTGGMLLQDSGKVKANIESMHRVYKNMLLTFCTPVLSRRDIKNIIERGAEVYYSGTELLKKLS